MADPFPPPPAEDPATRTDPPSVPPETAPSTAPGSPPTAPPVTPPPPVAPLAPPVAPVTDASTDGSETTDGPPGVNRTPFIVLGIVIVVVLLVGLVVALVSDASSDESYSLQAALDNAAAETSVEYEMTLLLGDEPAFTVEGAVDGDVQLLRVDLGATLGADAVSGSTAEIIIDGDEGVLYIQADELIPSTSFDFLIPDLGWVAIDVASLGLGGDTDGGSGGGGLDIGEVLTGSPLSLVDQIDVDASEATDLGAETIDGVETRHYQFTADVAASIEIPEELADLADRFGFDLMVPEGALGEVTYDIWVTEDNQIRRVAVAFEIADEHVSLLLDVHAIGGDVEVDVPTADEVFDLQELLEFGAIFDLGELFGS